MIDHQHTSSSPDDSALLWAYFDDSRRDWSRNPLLKRFVRVDLDEIVALGGSVGTADGWCRLVRRWQRTLEESNQGWFHAEEWNRDPDRFDRPWGELIAAMNECLIAHVGCVVPAHAVRLLQDMASEQRVRLLNDPDAPKDERRWEQHNIVHERDPLTVCVSWCLQKLSEVVAARPGRTVAIVFADTDKLQGREAWISGLLNRVAGVGASPFGPKFFGRSPRDLLQPPGSRPGRVRADPVSQPR